MIGVVKSCIKKTLGRSLITTDELRTLVVSIEAIINDRLLTVSGSDPKDLTALTPSQMLCGHRLTTLPSVIFDKDPTFNEKRLITARQQRLGKLKVTFWNRWRAEYLPSLRERKLPKFGVRVVSPEEGEVVLVHDEQKRALWSLARVKELIRGTDGQIRSAVLATTNGDITRPVTKLYPLEVRSIAGSPNIGDSLATSGEWVSRPKRSAAQAARRAIAEQLA